MYFPLVSSHSFIWQLATDSILSNYLKLSAQTNSRENVTSHQLPAAGSFVCCVSRSARRTQKGGISLYAIEREKERQNTERERERKRENREGERELLSQIGSELSFRPPPTTIQLAFIRFACL
jgi:hypothetical protein